MVKRKFIKTSEAIIELGRSRFWLINRIKSGSFTEGQHYINTSNGMRPTYEFCIEAIEELIYGKS